MGMGWEKEWDDGMGGRGLEGSELVRSSDSMCMYEYVRMKGMGGRGWDKRRKIKCVPILLSRVKRVDREPKNFSGGRAREDGECWRSERGKGSTQPAAGNKLDQACGKEGEEG